MKILHTVGGFSMAGGGVTVCLRDLLSAMQGGDDDVKLLTVKSEGPIEGDGASWLKTVPNDYRTPLALSRNLARALREADADVFHTNGLWMHVNHLTAKEARRRGIPLVLSPHGMLYPDALRRSAWKKRPLRWLWFDRDINSAAAIHVTCRQEADNVRLFGYKGRIEIVSNPFVIPRYIDDVVANRRERAVPTIGFLGRLHPVKGIEWLVDAFAAADKARDFRLEIMGSGLPEYEASLRRRVDERGISSRVDFVGEVGGRDKFERLASLSALFVPSDFENFGMIVPESLIVNTPVVASLTTPWESLRETGSGWWTSREIGPLSDVINEIAEMSTGELREMGRRGAQMVCQRFEASVVAAEMSRFYHSIG